MPNGLIDTLKDLKEEKISLILEKSSLKRKNTDSRKKLKKSNRNLKSLALKKNLLIWINPFNINIQMTAIKPKLNLKNFTSSKKSCLRKKLKRWALS